MTRTARPVCALRILIALLGLAAAGAAGAQSRETYAWTEGPVVVPGTQDPQPSLLKQRFLDVYCIDMPDLGPVENIVHGTLSGGAVSYYRLAYANGLHGHVVTSTLPRDRTPSEEYARLLQREQANHRAVATAASAERYRVDNATSSFGPTVKMRLLNIEGGNEEGPFPVTRPLLNVPDEPLYSLSVHRLFVRGGSRYEVAVLGVPAQGESRATLEARAERLADTMLDSLHTCTAAVDAARPAAPAR